MTQTPLTQTTLTQTTTVDAEQIAFEFLMADLNLLADDRDWFTVLGSRCIDDRWYVVEIGVEGFPDKWVLQVWDTGVCDPSYTFVSPLKATADISDLIALPETIAATIAAERSMTV